MCYLVGDVNLNLLAHKSNTKVRDYLFLTPVKQIDRNN